MKLQECLDLEQLFHPALFYEGEWLLGGEIDIFGAKKEYLAMNAKKKGKVNLFEQYLEENYYKPLSKIVDSEYISRSFPPRIIFSNDNSGQRRMTLFCLSNFVFYQIAGLDLLDFSLLNWVKKFNDDFSRNDLLKDARQMLGLEKKCYEDVLNCGVKSKYYDKAYATYTYYKKNNEFDDDFKNFIEIKIITLEKLITADSKCLDFFEKEIDIKGLLECFDYDEFCLLAARSAIDACYLTERTKGLVDNSICFVRIYLEAIKRLKESNKNYYCQIVIPSEKKGKKRIITVDDIEKEYHEILSRHPEFSFIETNPEQIDNLFKYYGFTEEQIRQLDFSRKDGEEIFMSIFEQFKRDRELVASWDILPKGKVLIKEEEQEKEEQATIEQSNEEHVRRMIIGRNFLDNSPYVYKLYGQNKFAGYIGYIYPNGIVIFEKFYENEKTYRVARNSATYVMNVFNFVELTKLSKVEIIDKLKQGEIDDVYRIFHRYDMDKWKEEVTRAFSGSEYSIKDIDYITALISRDTLSKKGVK